MEKGTQTKNASRPSIWVALSTYNGAAYIEQQLQSVLGQDVTKRADLYILVRDDGSTDGTLDVLEAYEKRGEIVLHRGKNEGVVQSFLDAIALVDHDADYIALCDQDDIWHADKLSRALSKLEELDTNKPLLYCSEYIFCDENMHPQSVSHHNRRGVSFATMLFEDVASGNTMVFNRNLADLVIAAGKTDVYQHDWWLALTASALGTLFFDDFASLDYRRLSSSVSPTGSSGIALLRTRIRLFFKNGQFANISAQLRRFGNLYVNELEPQKRELLMRFLDGGRFRKAFTQTRLRQKMRDELALRLLFLAGLL